MNIYIGNLSYSMTEKQLTDLFSQFGSVASAKVITDRITGNSKGFGFVEMENAEEAQQAIDQLNGTEVEGRRIRVIQARSESGAPSEHRPRGGGGGRPFNRNRRFGGPR